MKFIINREQILPSLQQIVSVVEKRQTIPILANVLLQVDEQQLVMTATDTEIQIVTKLNLENCLAQGSITAPAKKLLDICRLLPNNAEISLDAHEDKMKLVAGRSRFSLSTLPAEHYPDFSETQFEYQF